LCGTGLYRFRGQIVLVGSTVTGRTWSWTVSFSTRHNWDTLQCCICYCNEQHTTVQHIEHLNTHSVVLSACWVTVAVKYLTTETAKCTFPLDIRHSVTVEHVKFATMNINVGRSCKTLVNSWQIKRIVFYGCIRWENYAGWVRKISIISCEAVCTINV